MLLSTFLFLFAQSAYKYKKDRNNCQKESAKSDVLFQLFVVIGLRDDYFDSCQVNSRAPAIVRRSVGHAQAPDVESVNGIDKHTSSSLSFNSPRIYNDSTILPSDQSLGFLAVRTFHDKMFVDRFKEYPTNNHRWKFGLVSEIKRKLITILKEKLSSPQKNTRYQVLHQTIILNF